MSEPSLVETTVDHRLVRRITAVLDLEPSAGAIEFERQWTTWGEIGDLARQIADVSRAHGGDAPEVGILLRNRPAHVAAFLGVLLAGGCVVVINPSRGDERTRSDIADLDLPVLIGSSDDLANLVDPRLATTTVTIDDVTTAPAVGR
ncbi:long-chain fatty acid--CoA ligase, partial [Streptomyces sp. SID10244]|nr:long-chain fatty acid--CoA ligase [Streptomyces sp. SID10244]